MCTQLDTKQLQLMNNRMLEFASDGKKFTETILWWTAPEIAKPIGQLERQSITAEVIR